MIKSKIEFLRGDAKFSTAITPLIYESVHELMDFMFLSRVPSEAVLDKLLQYSAGQFSYRYTTVMQDGDSVVGVVLGYGRQQFLEAELPGALNMLRATPVKYWLRMIGTVNKALSNYVPPPSVDAFYINNIAVDSAARGKGYGAILLKHIINDSRTRGYRGIELDVTHINEGAIRFYERSGFLTVSESGSEALFAEHKLPILKRMRLNLPENSAFITDQKGNPANSTNPTVIKEVTGLYPVQVDEVYVPGTVDQLQNILRSNDKPISIGGGRYSMGGQTASPDTLHIDMRGLNRVLKLDTVKQTILVQSGIRWKEIQQRINNVGLAVKIMQTYSNFTVGGSLSVNCHGRYVGLGPLILSVKSIKLLLHDGELVTATARRNSTLFYAAIGGYGAIGIIVEAELTLAENKRIERKMLKMPIEDYQGFFQSRVRDDAQAVFHNADMIPPNFSKVRAITWVESDLPVNASNGDSDRKLYLLEKYMLWAITETPAGHFRREYIYEPLLYLRKKVAMRNQEAEYDVAELEPLSRESSTYVLQEYFVAPEYLQAFVKSMAEILNRHQVSLVNVSIRHAHVDPGSKLAWARQEVFALVLYYKQGTDNYHRSAVAVWTRELIDAVIEFDGAYYLPYQPHARHDQFHRCYPNANELFKLKRKYDPEYRFRNILWEKYYQLDSDQNLFPEKARKKSEFLSVYGAISSRDDFYRFLQVIYHLYPESKFHQIILEACHRYNNDKDIYQHVATQLPGIKTRLSDLTFALPALAKQKNEMQQQTVNILNGKSSFDGYLEIGSTGRYVKKLTQALALKGEIYLCNDNIPDNSPPEMMERGGIGQVGNFFPLNDYEPIPQSVIADQSLDLVTCYIGLHHCPRKKLKAYIASVKRVLRPSGRFILRDHDAGDEQMKIFCSLVHTVFNAGLGVEWADDRKEIRLFESVDFWVTEITKHEFVDNGQRLLQANDPSRNTLLCFSKPDL
jgi:FAD/FMN-containing dehydrogenase/ribosomal protein S18 acetylase RimI-like enzyme